MRKIQLFLVTILAAAGMMLSACNSSTTGADLAGTSWTLVSYGSAENQTSAAVGVQTNLDFSKDDKISGNLGCNGFGGEYRVKGAEIVFDQLISTMMACPEPRMTQENTAFKVLNGTVQYQLDAGTLAIHSAGNTLVLTFAMKK